MKNYYEILEVDKKASPEVIEKAYKTLVKKYHPDLQDNQKQALYEEKMKEINEAYSVLTDDYKKTNYDEQLQETTVSIEEYQRVLKENEQLKAQLGKEKITNNVQSENTISNMGKVMRENMRQATAQAYQDAYKDAYVQDMKNRGYRIKETHDFKYYLKFTGCLCIVILVFVILYQIPVIKRFCNQLYEDNLLIQSVIDVFKKTFSTKV